MINRRVMLFESWNQTTLFNAIMESVSGEIKNVEQSVTNIMDELKDEGDDAESDEVKAAILMQAMDLADEGKDIEDLDLDQAKADVKEGLSIRGKSYDEVNESLESVVHILEYTGNVLGNSALLEFIAHKIEKATGQKPDMGKMAKAIEGIAIALKTVTGLPAKAIEKFFEWIANKFGFTGNTEKGAGLIGKLVVIVFLFGVGWANFPVLGTGILWWLLSLTGLVGKSVEVVTIGKDIFQLIAKAGEGKDDAVKELGMSQDDIEKIAA